MAKESPFLHQQKIALGIFVLILAIIAGYLIWTALAPTIDGEFVEGEHYQLIDNPRRIRGDTIEVMEFFSYGCVHCYNFDPDLTAWAEERTDQVTFIRVPAVANTQWRLLARNYYTMQELGLFETMHTPFFRLIHEGRQVFDSVEDIGKFYEARGVTREAFDAAFNSTAVNNELVRADQLARRMQIASVPTIVVQGKYLVRATREIGPSRMLDVMDYLVEKELNAAPAS